MSPFLQAGDLIRHEPVARADASPGDVVLIQHEGRRIAHRLLDWSDGQLTTMGDANLQAERTTEAGLIGRVVQVRRRDLILQVNRAADCRGLDRLVASLRRRQALAARGPWGLRLAWLQRLVTSSRNLRIALTTVRGERVIEAPETRAALLARFRALATGDRSGCEAALDEDCAEALARHGLDLLDARVRGASVLLHPAALAYVAARRTLVRAVAELERAGIPYAVLKGLSLAEELHGTDPVRPSSDVDLLVPPRCRSAAVRALMAAGWMPPNGPIVRGLLARFHFHQLFVPPEPGLLPIELHWHLEDTANFHRLDEAAMWTRIARRAGVPRLDPPDEFIHLCLHAGRHAVRLGEGIRGGHPADWFVASSSGVRLIWFLDILRHLQRFDSQDFRAVVRQRAEQWNVRSDLASVLHVLDLFIPGCGAGGLVPQEGAGRSDSCRDDPSGSASDRAALPVALPGVVIRPERLARLGELFFPCAADLIRYHRAGARGLPLLRCWHPVHMLLRLMGFRASDSRP